ncbi:ArsR/SmtB family transcription factor [Streptomyces tsukubensis]|uniref:Transcriptional regulator n=1 Tax=Streptomyces tsukubensis TaxID=83656 RepID=A0A1V4A837_9ACTN|nr:metalloregulator ArsR/SmtB family transcription factor [Streptomyces tsukubensis]OON78000.1 transcriptional regulator [Streptomyces tsukubensis]QFR97163.1 metalloregulator ArsR/SmtB family transcription factor [Streptomyces tsukubensis]
MVAGDDLAGAGISRTRAGGGPQFAAAARVFALLSDPTRLRLMWVLARGEADVSTLTAASGAARPAVSQHLAKLRAAGLVQARKDGRRALYTLRDGRTGPFLNEALRHASRVPGPRHRD